MNDSTTSVAHDSPAGPMRRDPRKWLRRGVIALVITIIAIAVIGFFAVPPIAKDQAQKMLSRELGREVTIDRIRFNPFTMEAAVEGFVLKEASGGAPALRFDELYVNAEAASLFHRAIVIKAVRLVRPVVSVTRFEDGRYSFQDLVDRFAKQPPSDGPPPRFSVNNIELVDGRLELDDRPERLRHVVAGLQVGVPFVSSLPVYVDINVDPRLEATINGDPIRVTGHTKPFKDSLETTVNLDAAAIDLARYVEYIPGDFEFKLASAKLATALEATFTRYPNKPAKFGLRGTARITDLALVEKNSAPLIAAKEIAMHIADFDSGANKLVVEEIGIAQPQVRIHRNAAGEINLLKLVPASTPSRADAKPSADAAFILALRVARIDDGAVEFSDDALARPFRTRLTGMHATLSEFVSGSTDTAAVPAKFEAKLAVDGGATLAASGDFALAPLKAEGRLDVAGVRPKDFAAYYDRTLLVDIEDGQVDVGTRFSATLAGNEPEISLTELALTIKSLAARQRGDRAELARVGRLEVSSASIDTTRRSVAISEVRTQEARINVRRARDGVLNLERLVGSDDTKSAPAGQPGPPWNITVKRLAVDKVALAFADDAVEPSVALTVDPIALTVENFSTAPNARSTIALRAGVNNTGSIALTGPTSINPLAAQWRVDVKALDVVPFQPYFSQFVNLVLTAGNVTTQGALSLAMRPNASPDVTYSGDLNVADLASADKAGGQELLRWKSLFLGEVSAKSNPVAVAIKEIALADFYSRLILSREGRLNLQDLIVQPAGEPPNDGTPPSTSTDASAKPDIRIGRITLTGGNVNFSDFFVKPNYTANLTGLGGAVSSLAPDEPGDIDLRGAIDRTAPLEISGRINPLGKDLYLDIKANARGIDLPALTPYSAKYVGYGIDKGKMTVKVAYKIENRKLEAENNVYLDQLTFGDKVESPDALKVPVLLAVALLKDRDGVIDINLPISGSLDDPQFSIGGLIVRVIVNLIVKAVTSPFALLSAAFGSDHGDLSYVEFDPGKSALSAAALERLSTLAKALTERPALKLDIVGRVDLQTDRDGLRRERLDGLMRTQKFLELAKKGTPPSSIDVVAIEPAEYQRFLEIVYRQATFPKPRNALGLEQSLPAAEMEKLLITNLPIEDDDLRNLASLRAQEARDWFLDRGAIDAERIFVIAPKIDVEAPKEGKASRTQFELR